jgi:[ribosomal protein S18]-alanine N-acetyltransferase
VLVAATPAHAAAMALLHSQAFPPRERWGADAIGLQLGLPGAFGWIAFADGMILARVAADEAEVLTLAVDAAAQRRGVGRALLRQALTTARERGAGAIFLEVASENTPAQALYAGENFTVIGRRSGYYPGGGDALLLSRPL